MAHASGRDVPVGPEGLSAQSRQRPHVDAVPQQVALRTRELGMPVTMVAGHPEPLAIAGLESGTGLTVTCHATGNARLE